ncbi:MAG TPA: hypothetical protein VIK18_06425 [Pirellulales bacterium]
MKAFTVAVVIACLLVCALGFVAQLQLGAIKNGIYDPVRDDGFAVADIPALVTRLNWARAAAIPAFLVLCFAVHRLVRKSGG